MGDVIRLDERRAARRQRAGKSSFDGPSRVEFLFDLCCPYTYLAAERVERAFDDVIWTPASTTALRCGSLAADREAHERLRSSAERRAAAFACEQGRGAPFVLAAGRLAYCGGFDLEDPEILAEAAAAAGIGMDGCLQAVGDLGRDGAIEAAGRRLLAAGADRLPALRVGRSLFWGENRVAEAAAMARVRAAAAGR